MSLDQIRAMHFWEIEKLLKGGKIDIDELNDRQKFCIDWYEPNKHLVFTGAKALRLLKSLRFEKKKKQNLNNFTGTCAFPGIVRGRVKIINIPEQMHKMKKGDILVAHNTNPNLVLAMRKASALISGAGGLTCHTAIVARELQIPSIVGITGIDRLLKDGDLVEVDAGKGIVRKI